MKLLIAIPTMDFAPVPFMKSLIGLVQRLDANGIEYDVCIESGTLIHLSRDRLAQKAVNKGYSHVLWLDSDMVFRDGILEDLQFSGKKFVSGIAHGRRSPFLSCLFKDISLDHLERWESKDYPTSTFEVAGCGLACCLITTDILKAVLEHDGTAFYPLLHYGEDLSFCKRAAALGYKIYAEPTVRVGHIGHLTIWPEDAERYRDAIR